MTIPPYLKKGDTIGIVAPAGFMPVEKMQACIETLDNWGYNVEMGPTTHSQSDNYFSGTDWERPNWRLRHAVTVDDLAADEAFTSRMRRFVDTRPPGEG